MKKYLRYLLTDIETAKKNVPQPQKTKEDPVEIFKGVDEFANSPLKTMGEWFGLDAKIFPPVERWTDVQVHRVVRAFLKLWYIYNYDADFPRGVDMRLKYKLLVNSLNERVPWVSVGVITIDFCNSDTSNCALGEHCVCKEFSDSFWETPFEEEDIILAQPDAVVEISSSMQRYFEQLVSDLGEAIRMLPLESEEDENFLDHLENEVEDEKEFLDFLRIEFFEEDNKKNIDYSEDDEENREQKAISEWLQISKEVFPELEQLSVEMRIELVRSIEQLWWHAGFVPCFPENVPIEMKYELFRNSWDKLVPYPINESVYVHFCNKDEKNCIYGRDMCDCRKYSFPWEDDEEDDEEKNDNSNFGSTPTDLPF